jgi:hypothetical protein
MVFVRPRVRQAGPRKQKELGLKAVFEAREVIALEPDGKSPLAMGGTKP